MPKIIFSSLVLCCVSAYAGNPADGLQFMLDFRSGESNITAKSVGNALNFSGTSIPVATLSGGETDTNKVHQIPVKCVVPLYPWQTNDVYALCLPQRTKYVENNGVSELRVNPVALSFSDSAVKSERQTTYVRFRWGGPIDDTTSTVAWMILNGYNWSATGTDGTVGVGWGVGIKYINNIGRISVMATQTSKDLTWDGCPVIEKDVWYDLFISFEPDQSDATKSKVTLSIVKPTTSSIVDGELVYAMPSMKTQVLGASSNLKRHTYSSAYSSLRLGAESAANGYQSTTYNWGGYAKGFRGEIAQLMMWDRLLDEEEKWQVMSGCWGSTFNLGLANGSADEFASEVDGESVWTPGESWASVRRILTEENPSLIIRYTIPQRELGIGKILHIKPVNAGASLPVELYVNGESIGVFDLRFSASRSISIPGEKWQNAEDGKVQIKIVRRAPFTAPLEIDAVTLGGGWRMEGSMTREGYVRSHHYIGTDDSRTLQRATTVQPVGARPYVSFSSWIPDDSLAMFRHTLSVKIKGGNADVPHAFWVNGRQLAEFASSLAGETLSAAVPPEFLVAGENVFTVSNRFASATATKWARYSEYVIEVKRVYGLSVVLR